MTSQDWLRWNAWNAKNIYSDNTLWLDVLCFLAWQTEWRALVARLVAGNIKYIYLQCCRILDDHTILDYYQSWGYPRTLVQGFVDYVHANSNIKVLAWGLASPTVNFTTSAYRQQMLNAISAFVQSYGFDGYMDDTEELGSNSPQNMVDYWNLIGTTMKSIGKVSAAALAIWHITDVGRYITTLDWMELMDYYTRPLGMPDFITSMESALTYSASPVVWGVYAYDTNPDGTFTLIEQEAAIDNYLSSGHDIGIVDYEVVKTVVGGSYALGMEVRILNYGLYDENFLVTVYANLSIAVRQGVELAKGNSAIITLTWNTTGFAYGNYTISVCAGPVLGETKTGDNNFTGGWIVVSLVGDITGPNGWPDGKCDILDIAAVARIFRVNYPNPQYNPNYDINSDGKINIVDIATVAMHCGEHYP